MQRLTKVLGISGSLRKASVNSMLLRVTARVAPASMAFECFDGIGALPLFNPDLESSDPAPVALLRASIIASDAVLIASPEYAHGVSGVIKNALDWMVGNESFVGKPVAVVNTSPRASHAHAALCETLRTMSALVVEEACVAVPLLGSGLDDAALLHCHEMTVVVTGALQTLQAAAGAYRELPSQGRFRL